VINNPVYILAILSLNIAICEWLALKPVFKHIGTALLVILLTAIMANIGLVPTSTSNTPTYGIIFDYIAPLSIFYLLLDVNLKSLKKAGLPMLSMFLLGSVGTVAGVLVADKLVGGANMIGQFHAIISGMFTGTYIGGSINFNAVALNYNIQEQGNLYAGAVAIDNIITAAWMVVTIMIPKFLQLILPISTTGNTNSGAAISDYEEKEAVSPWDLGKVGALGLFALLGSEYFTVFMGNLGIRIPAILVLTTVALVLAQIPAIHRLKGGRILGLFMVYMFLAVIGAYCDLHALGSIGELAVSLLAFATILVLVHGLILFGIGGILKQNWQMLSIASQANIGGSSSALALAKAFNRHDLLLPAVLVGALGNALGTYVGFFVVYWLG